jgi:outer membrane lipoprotein-sorting protein
MYYVAEDKQMVKTPVSSANEHSPAQYLAGRGDFVKDFRAEWSDPRPGSHLLKLTPIQEQPDFRELIVDVDPITGLILKLTVLDQYGNRTEYAFVQIQENPQLPANFCSFIPPPGTDIIFERQGAEDE